MINDFRKNGYAPEVLNNFLALQGWSPGGDLEQMTIEQMIEKFSLDRIISANPKFNRDKLKSFSTDFFAAASPERLLSAMKDYLDANPSSPLNAATDAQLIDVLKMNTGFRILSEVEDKSRFFFIPVEQIAYDPAAIEKVLVKNDRQGFAALKQVRELLSNASDWSAHSLEEAVKAFCEQSGLGLGKVAQPLRVAISGSAVSPPIFDSLVLLGRDQTLARIDRCLSVVG
jgi:glutamyl/glutaminyl-tRNA synthetase